MSFNVKVFSLFIDFDHLEADSLLNGALFFRTEDHNLVSGNAEALLFGNPQNESNESIAVQFQVHRHFVANNTTARIHLVNHIR